MRTPRVACSRIVVVLAIAITASQVKAQAPAVPPTDFNPRWQVDATPVDADWIQLKSSEWLKGKLFGMYDNQLEFDSDEMGLRTIDWEDIYEVRTSHVMEIGREQGEVAIGKIVIDLKKALVITSEGKQEFPRSDIVTITPSAQSRLKRWTGKMSYGMTVLAGNVDQIDSNVNVDLKRRSVTDRVVLDYIANFSKTNGDTVSDNQRLKGNWDRFLTSQFFVKPFALETFRDQFQNLDARTTLGAGAGYQIFEKPNTKWEVAAGLAYQQTKFINVEEGVNENPKTAAFTAGTKFEQNFTKSITLKYDYTFHITNEASGRYNHNMVTTIETEWTKVLDLDLTFVWDRTQLPKADANGVVPKQDDFRMVIALGIEF